MVIDGHQAPPIDWYTAKALNEAVDQAWRQTGLL
jgi:hypothetical protein